MEEVEEEEEEEKEEAVVAVVVVIMVEGTAIRMINQIFKVNTAAFIHIHK